MVNYVDYMEVDVSHLIESDARAFEAHGVTFRSFARLETGSRELAAWRAEFAPRTPGCAHRVSKEEILHVLTGELAVEVDHHRFAARPGDVVLVPAGARFRVGNDGDVPAHAWVVTTLGLAASMGDGADAEAFSPPWAN